MTIMSSPQATNSLETWLSYLETSHCKAIDLGLERVKSVAYTLDLLKPAPYIITVAGTNGKGSTCKFLETALLKAGKKVGVYSSPHLIRYNERVRINGELLDDDAHIRSFVKITEHKKVSLSYFEYSTLSALDLFKQANLDVVILEVGLGGRLDATNIVDPDFAVITSIDIDHIAFLGDNREDIGREKAGIFRPNIPVVIGEKDCPQSIIEQIKLLGCQAFICDKNYKFSIKSDRFIWQSDKVCFENLALPKIPYPNVATALAVLTHLPFKISETIIEETVIETQLTGRFQFLTQRDFVNFSKKVPLAQVIVDVGHNPHATRYLAERLIQLKQPHQKIYALFSVLEDKDLNGIITPLQDIINEWHCVTLDCFRGQRGQIILEKMVNFIPNVTAYHYENMEQATNKVFDIATEKDVILVFGSFHTVSDFLLSIKH
ncbi:bifunctional tetrahydrofolate synthase/dihydrofolate synthase [Pasteurella atlantica]|uniref:Bifunctional tetrahydrofolate synthase/dihydrofolate synthase n=2 Tax=Pasteurellaceae TaxID=712 RepID=A0ACC6HL24_9PAST|nr:bifunctional tetrahydrofolate synthase/dihydrofolate synthase [Pasteurella atlantica]MDP8051591.1 bifunctional tetrahydrofolate synthase/dihydrofolate synthase [Pasteurella atlantica]MDP8104830.1 bifunctional tetrahydrofolate synthase/dihydrofolate synthase [Pasteurella atlantica]MDP8148204.1 bifunctional tetrahydrofolate synthase/dihydrofolate synthase [Pasteurella atlantica]